MLDSIRGLHPAGRYPSRWLLLGHFLLQIHCYGEPLQPIQRQRAFQWKELVNKTNLNGSLPFICGTAPLPPTLRGIFWLTHQGASSVLASFGGPCADGGDLCLGRLVGPHNSATLRLEGERTFSTAAPAVSDRVAAAFVDGAYHFQFNDPINPTFGQIYVRFLKPFDMTFTVPSWMSNYSMTLEGGGSSEYPNSVVWKRITSMMGFDSGHTYELVQVVDENFNRIEPAFTMMVDYESKPEVGDGWMYYRSTVESPTPEDEQHAREVDASLERQMLAFWIFFALLIICLLCCCVACCAHFCCPKNKKKRGGNFDDDPSYYDDLEDDYDYEEE